MINICLVLVLLISAVLPLHQVSAQDDSPVEDILTFLDVDTLFTPGGSDANLISAQMLRLRALIVDSLDSANEDDVIVERVVGVSSCSRNDMQQEDVAAIALAVHEAAVAQALEYAANSPDDTTTTTVTTYTLLAPVSNYRILLFGALVCWAVTGLVAIVWIVIDAMKSDSEDSDEHQTVSLPPPSLNVHASSDHQSSQYQLREPLLNDTAIMV